MILKNKLEVFLGVKEFTLEEYTKKPATAINGVLQAPGRTEDGRGRTEDVRGRRDPPPGTMQPRGNIMT